MRTFVQEFNRIPYAVCPPPSSTVRRTPSTRISEELVQVMPVPEDVRKTGFASGFREVKSELQPPHSFVPEGRFSVVVE